MGMHTLLNFGSLEDLLVLQLQDLYDAENRIMESLPKMADAARSPDLAEAFRDHYKQTQGHAKRLETILDKLGRRPEREMSSAMSGLTLDCEEVLHARGDAAIRDTALIGAARRIEHYEMSGYDAARDLAKQMHLPQIAAALSQTLAEEAKADRTLAKLGREAAGTQAAQ